MTQYSPVRPVAQGDEAVLACVNWDRGLGRAEGYVHVVVKGDDVVLACVSGGPR